MIVVFLAGVIAGMVLQATQGAELPFRTRTIEQRTAEVRKKYETAKSQHQDFVERIFPEMPPSSDTDDSDRNIRLEMREAKLLLDR